MSKIGLNLFSLRSICQTLDELDDTLKRVADIGYPSVQVSGIPLFDSQKILDLLQKHGLVACACHENLPALRSERGVILDKLKTLGVTFTALGAPPQEMLTPELFPSFVEELETFAQDFKKEGIRFGYHNHAFEFQKLNGSSLYELIFEGAPSLYAEPDTHWIQRGGADSVGWIRRLKGRIPAVHVKDYVWRDGEPQFAEVGYGNMDWDSILEACKYADVEYYIVEQDQPTPGVPILESVAKSFDFLSKRL